MIKPIRVSGAAVVDGESEVRQRLLNAAVHEFSRKGYAAASVRDIAEHAGVTKPALYYHFGSKEGVFVAVLQRAYQQLVDTLARAAARPGTARERITALCEDVYGLSQEIVPLSRVVQSVFLGAPDATPPFDITRPDRDLRAAIETMVTEGQQAGAIREANPGDVALAIAGILHGCASRQLLPAPAPVGAAGLRRLLDLFFDGLIQAPDEGTARSSRFGGLQ